MPSTPEATKEANPTLRRPRSGTGTNFPKKMVPVNFNGTVSHKTNWEWIEFSPSSVFRGKMTGTVDKEILRLFSMLFLF